jgi:hypothetical protein
VSRTASIRALSPDPQGADGEVDGEPGGDPDQVGDEVEQAEPDEQLDDADVEHQRAEGDHGEVHEPAWRQAHRAERPHLVQDVVVRGGRPDRDHRRGEQRQPGQPVQRTENGVVDQDSARADGEEPAYPGR